MDSIDTMNLNDDDAGMVPLKNNNVKEQEIPPKMDSTPIAEIMMPQQPPAQSHMPPGPAMGGQEPPIDPAMFMQAMQPPMPEAPRAPAAPVPAKKNPMNLTDEQMEALLVGAIAVIAFSKPVQDKLRTSVPQFVNEMGNLSLAGMAGSGLVAAIMFYFGRNMLKQN